jgi:phage anti-repressor protein/uncharacterized C2H2 Zn-finger protein
MSKLQLSQINISNYIDTNQPMLSVYDLLNRIGFDYSNVHFDILWKSINDNIWIYINDEMISWIGILNSNLRQSKLTLIDMLTNNFDSNDYKVLSKQTTKNEDYTPMGFSKSDISKLVEGGPHNKTYLLVSPITFKELIMMLNTDKCKQIRRYYIELEQIFKLYNQYVSNYSNCKLITVSKELELEKEKTNILTDEITGSKILDRNEYIYICTNKIHELNSIYKVGKCRSLKSRLSGYNTGHANNQKYFYVYSFKCYDSKILEEMIHAHLKSFSIKSEMYKINIDLLKVLVKTICQNYDDCTSLVNQYIETKDYHELSNNSLEFEGSTPVELEGDDLVEKITKISEDNILGEYTDYIKHNQSKFKYDKNKQLKTCPRCFKDFVCHDRLLSHLRNQRCGSDEHKANILQTELLAKALNLEESKVIPSYKCVHCNQSFLHKYQLDGHLENKTCRKFYRCPRCPNTKFNTTTSYKRHVNLVHKENKIKCKHCETILKHKDSFRDHNMRNPECAKYNENVSYKTNEKNNLSETPEFDIALALIIED